MRHRKFIQKSLYRIYDPKTKKEFTHLVFIQYIKEEYELDDLAHNLPKEYESFDENTLREKYSDWKFEKNDNEISFKRNIEL